MRHLLCATIFLLSGGGLYALEKTPNVILIMCDDLGWGDTGYNGSTVIKTPALDQMAKEGLKMNRFYSASAVCSPTRASCLTGRNPFRTGVPTANSGFLRPEEVTLSEVLKNEGYATGHFGKWHLGTLTHTEKDANRGKPGNTKDYNPPKLHGYDTAFVTESKVPTYDPMVKPVKFDEGESLKLGWEYVKEGEETEPYGTFYWDIEGQKVTDHLNGDDSKVIMDRVLPFVDKAVREKKPFFSVIWFHAPHLPCVAGPKHQEMYKDQPIHMRNYAGCITALDEQIGRLREHLKTKGVDENTMIWFCSDNGPESQDRPDNGSAGPYRGRKRDLYEGGVRVPGLLIWPAKIKQGRETDMPCVTSDYLPTVLDAMGLEHPQPKLELDGESLMPLIEGQSERRKKQLGFLYANRVSFSNEKYKIVSYAQKPFQLYDMENDPYEKRDVAAEKPEELKKLEADYKVWLASVKESFDGAEYGTKSVDRANLKWPYGEKGTGGKKGNKSKTGGK
ncbi:sulfatase [Rubritalea tangerina]|uniref:Sulfatase n=2 Tax=Rubritalea tangerina TaxID=430798 RepID=A0ABW4Z9D8_9BACT